MKIFISAASSRGEFIGSIGEVVDSPEFRERHQHIFIPLEPSPSHDSTLMNRIESAILQSGLILMDVTPEQVTVGDGNRWVTNQGVLIEYGLIQGFGWIHKLCVFCEARVNREHIHPAIHKSVDQYSIADLATFKENVRTIIRVRERRIEEQALQSDLTWIRAATTQAGSLSPYRDVGTGSR